METEIVLPSSAIANQKYPADGGRPKTRNADDCHHISAFVFDKKPKRFSRPYCRARGCNKLLREDQLLVCCAEHKEMLVHEAKWVLSLLDTKKLRIRMG